MTEFVGSAIADLIGTKRSAIMDPTRLSVRSGEPFGRTSMGCLPRSRRSDRRDRSGSDRGDDLGAAGRVGLDGVEQFDEVAREVDGGPGTPRVAELAGGASL